MKARFQIAGVIMSKDKTIEDAKQDVKDLLEFYKTVEMRTQSGEDMRFGVICVLEKLLDRWSV